MSIRNQRILIGAIAACLLLSAIFFYYNNIKIPRIKTQTEERIRREVDVNAMPTQLIAVVTAQEGISLYTEMTEDLVTEAITLVEIPTKYIVEGSIGDINSIKGMITKYSLNFGQQLLLDQFYSEENWYGEMERLKEFPVNSLVADEVKTGNIVDMIVDYGNGDYDVVVPKIKVRKIVSNATPENPQEKGYRIVLAVDEIQYRNLALAKELGELETRLYLDTNQPPSSVTFDYHSKLKTLRLDKVSTKKIESRQVETTIGYDEEEEDEDEVKESTGLNYRP